MTRPEYAGRSGYGALEDLSQDMERVFDSLLGRTVGTMLRNGNGEKFVPSLDVSETQEGFGVHVDLPGVNPDDVKIEMHDGKLTISGSRASSKETKEMNFHRMERSSGAFHRVIGLPSEVDVDAIEASYENGVLHVQLPKTAKQQPKKIQIRTTK